MSQSDQHLRAAAHAAGDAILASYYANAETDHQFSPEFEQKMNLLLLQTRRRPRHLILQKVASVLLAIALGGSLWLAIDTDARAAVFGWIKEQHENIFHYSFKGSIAPTSEQTYELGWVPEGYSFHHRNCNDSSTAVIYTNERGEIITLSYKMGAGLESSDVFVLDDSGTNKTVKVGEVPADLYLTDNPDDSNAIVWMDTDTMELFVISSGEDEKDLIKMAENIVPIKE